ncbi:MAG: baseplate assembly protein [Desulfobacteraceae bacterium]|nr:baseplate assembly protein [Desulfobacteraceae bacterium]
MLSRLLTLFQDKVENRYYGKYRGIVANNEDPEHRGRLQIIVPALTGEMIIGWAMPCFPYGGRSDTGFYMIPENEDGVWVEFEAGQLSYPIWTGTWWAQDEAPKGVDNEDANPDIKVIKSKSGNIIELNDKSGSESITIQDKNGNKVVMDSSNIVVSSDSRDVKINGLNITIEATSELNLKGATINMEASGNISIKGALVDLNP